MENLLDLNCNHLFDEHGDYIHTHEIKANLQHLEYTSNNDNNIINNDQILCAVYPHEMFESQSDFQSIQPQFGWLPINNIMKQFEKKTHFYQQPMSTRLLKCYKSSFPACNIYHCNEPIVTDTVYSNTPAISSGCKCAQIFVGTKTMVTDVYGMKT